MAKRIETDESRHIDTGDIETLGDIDLTSPSLRVVGGSVTSVSELDDFAARYFGAQDRRQLEGEVRRRLAAVGSLPEEGRILEVLRVLLDRSQLTRPDDDTLRVAAQVIADELNGLGPIGGLLRDPEVTEVMVNGPFEIYVERRGQLEQVDMAFSSADELQYLIERVCAPLGLRVDPLSPTVDARLPSGYRFNAIVAPVALQGPVVTIRKFAEDLWTLDDLVGFGTMTAELAAALERAVAERLNILISGRAACGKTTLLGCLLRMVERRERMVVIEDVAEVRVPDQHAIRLETRPANVEGRGEVSLRHLVRNALRIRPDRIIVGEVRGQESFDMLQALTSGQGGSMATVQAPTAAAALHRLQTMALIGLPGLTTAAAGELVHNAIDVVVQLARDESGRRVVSELVRVDDDGGLTPMAAASPVPAAKARTGKAAR